MTQRPDLSKLRIDREKLAGEVHSLDRFSKFAFRVFFILIVSAVVLAIIYAHWRNSGDSPITVPSQSSLIVQPTSAQAQPQTFSYQQLLNATGYVVAQRKAAVASKATGRLIALNVVEGDIVKKDQVLGLIESEDLQAQVRQREAQIDVLRARVSFAEAELEDARLKRERTLVLNKQNVESQEQVDLANARFNKAKAELESAKANVVLAKAQLDQAQVELGNTEVRAPFDGTVLTKNADVGEIVAPFGSAATARAAIVTIADMDSLEVEADISEANLSKVFVGQECEITLDSIPGRKYRGVVDKIVPTVDRAKATVMTKIRFIDRDEQIIPEMSAKVALRLAEIQ